VLNFKVAVEFAIVRLTFSSIKECIVEFRQYCRKFSRLSPIGESVGMYWRKFGGLSPIGECPEVELAEVQWTFANGESPVGESLIGEERATPQNELHHRQQ
jgi:hypothetical protein